VGANGSDVSDMRFKMMGLISSDPAQHTKKIKAMQRLGATAAMIMNISGRDPLGMVRVYGDEVLPALREGVLLLLTLAGAHAPRPRRRMRRRRARACARPNK
jgi:hypothetical protein